MLFIAVIKHHDQDDLQEKEVVWASGSRKSPLGSMAAAVIVIASGTISSELTS